MLQDDHVLHHFSKLFGDKGMSLLLSGDEEVSYYVVAVVLLLPERAHVGCYVA